MKKNLCDYCSNQPCGECSRLSVKPNGININPDLYAAEFMLYAFHFRNDTEHIRSNASNRTVPLTMRSAER